MLLGKNIDGDTIKSLIDGKVRESEYLEFKRETYGDADADKDGFLKSISAFANTLGGHLIIGMDKKKGIASSLEPISGNIDDELQRLENIVRTGIEPTILGLRMESIDIDNKNIIVIHIPRSFNPPHRVSYNGSNKYYGRHSSGAHELSLETLRQAFGMQRSIEERAKSFIGQRFLSIQDNDGIMPISEKRGVLVMHLVPLPNFGAGHRIEATALQAQHQNLCLIHKPMDLSWKINLEGCCIYDAGGDGAGYTQIFHNGVIEATTTELFRYDSRIPLFGGSQHLHRCLIKAINNYMRGLRSLEVAPPILLQISMMGVKDLNLGLTTSYYGSRLPYERDVLHLPPFVIDNFLKDKGYQSVIAEQMHFFWNALSLLKLALTNTTNR